MDKIREFFSTTAGKITALVVAALVTLFLVASCSRQVPVAYQQPVQQYGQVVQPAVAPAQVVAPAAQPVIVQNGSSGGSHFGETLLGSALGAGVGSYIGNKMAQPSQTSQPVITQQTVTTTAPAQRYAPAPQVAPRPATPVYQKPSVSTSSSRQGYQTTTRVQSSGRTTISTSRSTSGRR